MNIENIRNDLGDFAKDTKLNLSSILQEQSAKDLTQNQIYAIALASAFATKNEAVINAIIETAADNISEAEKQAAKAAASIMAMNNIYYRFVHLASDKEFGKMPTGLRMNVIANPGVAKIDFELYSLSISAINGCGMCIDAHVNQLLKENVSRASIQSAIKIAAVINAAALSVFINQF